MEKGDILNITTENFLQLTKCKNPQPQGTNRMKQMKSKIKSTPGHTEYKDKEQGLKVAKKKKQNNLKKKITSLIIFFSSNNGQSPEYLG